MNSHHFNLTCGLLNPWLGNPGRKAAVQLGVCVLGMWLFATSAEAQGGRQGRGAPRVIQLDEIRIEGRVQKPNAFYILNRSNLGYEVLDLRTSFLNHIVDSVQEEPF